jgi:ligand-binding sensor domain-containing protein
LDTTSVLEARDGALWVGTWGSGLVRRDRGARDFRSVHQGDGSVLALAEAPDGAVWFGTPTGLHRVDPRTGRVTRWHHAPEDPRGLGPGYVTSILSGSSGLWVGTGEGGLHRLRPDGHSFDRWRHDPADPASLSDDYITALLEDGPTLWVGTRSGGLNACKLDLSRCERHVPDASSARSLGHHFVTGILRDAGGRLWVGTGGGGLGRLDPAATGADAGFRRITQRDGLADDNVMGLVEDDDGSLWIATRDGLTRFAPRSGSVVTYGIGDGLPALEFNPRAAATGRGSLLFGTPRGLLIAQRGTPFPDHEPSPTVITAVDTLAGPAGDAPPWSLAALTLRYGDLLSLQFAVLDYGEVGRHRYAYRLAGLRDGWTDLGPRREVTFADLPPGATSCRSAAVTPAAWRVRQRSR